MRLIELCRERLPLAFHEVRYDRLVADFETTVRAMAEFAGIEWTDGFPRLRPDRAEARSADGQRDPGSARALRRAAAAGAATTSQLAPVLPILAPWVERFGFEA